MQLLQRNDFLQKLISTIKTQDIKVITGVRRSGKSRLLELFIDYIKNNFSSANIIHINFNLFEFSKIKTAQDLHQYVENFYDNTKQNFLLIDEVQLCENFEKAINSFHASEKYHIYITGSNAFLLSSDLATLFTGRTYSIEVFPFSFKEFVSYFKYSDVLKAFDIFTLQGGMAGAFLYDNIEEKYNYVAEVFDTLIVRDIVQKYKIKNLSLLDRLNDFLLDNISKEVSSRSIANTLTSNGNKVDDKTVASYIKYLCSSFVFYKVRRYDIKGKKYLASQEKYYLVDHAFKYAKLGTKNMDFGKIYESIVCIELLRRGYEVYTGVLYKKEIDFVAIKRSEQLYIQVCDDISSEETLEREVTPLLAIKDAYPKMIIARTKHTEYQYEGVRIVDIAHWLCGE